MMYRDSAYESQADPFDVPDVIQQLMTAWKSIPLDQKSMLVHYARQIWQVRGVLLARLVVGAFREMRRGLPMRPALYRTAQRLGVSPRSGSSQPGMSSIQVGQYRRRQMQRLPSNQRRPVPRRRR
jgi:hypothetical protein